MRSIVCAVEGGHAVDAGKDCGTTLVAVGVEFLLGQNVAACLWRDQSVAVKRREI